MMSMMLAGAMVAVLTQGSQAADQSLTAKATMVTEVRQVDLKPPQKEDEEGGFTFRMMMDKPELTVMLAVPMGKKTKLIGVEQPKTVVAKDSAGTDLSQIEAGFDGDREYLELNKFGFSDDEPKEEAELTLHLTPAARKAETFSVACEARVIVGGDAKDVEVPVVKAWTKLAVPDFASMNVMYRVKSEDGETILEFKTPEMKPMINKVAVVKDGAREESSGWMVMNGQLSYSVSAALEDGAKLVIQTYDGIKTLPLKIELKDLKLP